MSISQLVIGKVSAPPCSKEKIWPEKDFIETKIIILDQFYDFFLVQSVSI